MQQLNVNLSLDGDLGIGRINLALSNCIALMDINVHMNYMYREDGNGVITVYTSVTYAPTYDGMSDRHIPFAFRLRDIN